jgi:hypothetical protein
MNAIKGEVKLNRMRISLIILCLICTVILGFHSPGNIWAQPKPKIVVDAPFHNYGEVMRGEKVSHAFVMKNRGTADLIIKGAKPG